MEKKLWYALMINNEDTDWGTGTYDRDEAIQRMKDSDGRFTLIAVIDESGSGVCVDEIHIEDVH